LDIACGQYPDASFFNFPCYFFGWEMLLAYCKSNFTKVIMLSSVFKKKYPLGVGMLPDICINFAKNRVLSMPIKELMLKNRNATF